MVKYSNIPTYVHMYVATDSGIYYYEYIHTYVYSRQVYIRIVATDRDANTYGYRYISKDLYITTDT